MWLLAAVAVLPLGCINLGPQPGPSGSTIVTFDTLDQGVGAAGDFSVGIATFSNGSVLATGDTRLNASGDYAWYVSNTASVVFSAPVEFIELFFVNNGGATTITAFDDQNRAIATRNANAPTTFADPANYVTIDLTAIKPAVRVDIQHTGDGQGVIDDFEFRPAG